MIFYATRSIFLTDEHTGTYPRLSPQYYCSKFQSLTSLAPSHDHKLEYVRNRPLRFSVNFLDNQLHQIQHIPQVRQNTFVTIYSLQSTVRNSRKLAAAPRDAGMPCSGAACAVCNCVFPLIGFYDFEPLLCLDGTEWVVIMTKIRVRLGRPGVALGCASQEWRF